MLKNTRISRHMDVGRLGASLARPGIDTRCWVSLAIATEDSVVDQEHGVFVDVTLVPSGEEYTARVPADYAGGGFGFYAKIREDDELVVVVPTGDAAEGPVVVSRLWSAADLPPQQAVDDPEEVMLIVEEGKNLRLTTSGSGSIVIESGDVKIGSENASKEAARKTDAVDAVIPAGTVIVSVSGGSGSPAVGVLNPTDITLIGEITAGSGTVAVED